MDSRPPIVVEGMLSGNNDAGYAVLFRNGYNYQKIVKIGDIK